MNRILLCYFPSNDRDYTPLDIGYALARTNQANVCLGEKMKTTPLVLGYSKYAEDPLDSEVRMLLAQQPKVIIFFAENILWSSVFAWKRVRKFALELRKIKPDLVIGIQSYKADFSQLASVLSTGLVDFVIKANPEEVLPKLDNILVKEEVDGVFYAHNIDLFKKEVSKIKQIEQKANSAKANLDKLPSPYLTGVLDEFLKKKQKARAGKFSAFIYASRGCVFGCYYCWRSVKSERNVQFFSAERVYAEIAYLFEKFNIRSFFIIDDAFPYSKARLKNFLFEFEKIKKLKPELKEIELQAMCRIEMLDYENISLLAKLNVTWVQIGLQTINPTLQHYMNRKVEMEKFRAVSGWLKQFKIRCYLDIIAGLPGDSIKYFKKTIDFAVELEPAAAQVNHLFISPGTLFFSKKIEYEIEIEKEEHDFFVPSAVKARGIDAKYISSARQYISQKASANPGIKWRVVM